MPLMRTAAIPNLAITVARSAVAAIFFAYAFDLSKQTHQHLTNGAGRPFGDDFINFWSGAFLALHGRFAEVYDFNAFHIFEQDVAGGALDFYHYSYPPVLLVITAPLAVLPYVPALFAWLIAGWYAFFRALRAAMPNGGALLMALAAPAVFVNAVGGQNGTWTAALLCGGLGLLERRPYGAGVLFGFLIFKPQLALLLPLALVAGRQWRAFAAAAATAFALLGLSVALFGFETWSHYVSNLSVLRHAILEDGSGVWHRMVSVFVSARRLGASVETAYAVQAFAGICAGVLVAIAWFRNAPAAVRNAVLVLGTCLTTPYLQDYDLVFCVVAVAWLWQVPPDAFRSDRKLQIACGLLLVLPLFASALARLTGLAFGPLFILPAFVLSVQAALGRGAASPIPRSNRAQMRPNL